MANRLRTRQQTERDRSLRDAVLQVVYTILLVFAPIAAVVGALAAHKNADLLRKLEQLSRHLAEVDSTLDGIRQLAGVAGDTDPRELALCVRRAFAHKETFDIQLVNSVRLADLYWLLGEERILLTSGNEQVEEPAVDSELHPDQLERLGSLTRPERTERLRAAVLREAIAKANEALPPNARMVETDLQENAQIVALERARVLEACRSAHLFRAFLALAPANVELSQSYISEDRELVDSAVEAITARVRERAGRFLDPPDEASSGLLADPEKIETLGRMAIDTSVASSIVEAAIERAGNDAFVLLQKQAEVISQRVASMKISLRLTPREFARRDACLETLRDLLTADLKTRDELGPLTAPACDARARTVYTEQRLEISSTLLASIENSRSWPGLPQAVRTGIKATLRTARADASKTYDAWALGRGAAALKHRGVESAGLSRAALEGFKEVLAALDRARDGILLAAEQETGAEVEAGIVQTIENSSYMTGLTERFPNAYREVSDGAESLANGGPVDAEAFPDLQKLVEQLGKDLAAKLKKPLTASELVELRTLAVRFLDAKIGDKERKFAAMIAAAKGVPALASEDPAALGQQKERVEKATQELLGQVVPASMRTKRLEKIAQEHAAKLAEARFGELARALEAAFTENLRGVLGRVTIKATPPERAKQVRELFAQALKGLASEEELPDDLVDDLQEIARKMTDREALPSVLARASLPEGFQPFDKDAFRQAMLHVTAVVRRHGFSQAQIAESRADVQGRVAELVRDLKFLHEHLQREAVAKLKVDDLPAGIIGFDGDGDKAYLAWRRRITSELKMSTFTSRAHDDLQARAKILVAERRKGVLATQKSALEALRETDLDNHLLGVQSDRAAALAACVSKVQADSMTPALLPESAALLESLLPSILESRSARVVSEQRAILEGALRTGFATTAIGGDTVPQMSARVLAELVTRARAAGRWNFARVHPTVETAFMKTLRPRVEPQVRRISLALKKLRKAVFGSDPPPGDDGDGDGDRGEDEDDDDHDTIAQLAKGKSVEEILKRASEIDARKQAARRKLRLDAKINSFAWRPTWFDATFIRTQQLPEDAWRAFVASLGTLAPLRGEEPEAYKRALRVKFIDIRDRARSRAEAFLEGERTLAELKKFRASFFEGTESLVDWAGFGRDSVGRYERRAREIARKVLP